LRARKWGSDPQKIVLRRGRVKQNPLLKNVSFSPDYAKEKKRRILGPSLGSPFFTSTTLTPAVDCTCPLIDAEDDSYFYSAHN